MESNFFLSKNSSSDDIRRYFEAILKLAQSNEQYPINIDDVWMLVYSERGKAIRALKTSFIEGEDFKSVAQNGNGTKFVGFDYYLSLSCLEYFIARKVRPVFEVYRQVFHAVPDVAMKVRADKDKMAKLEKKVESLERQIKIVQGISKYETELKCSCFSFLTYTGLYLKWEEYRKGDISKEDLKVIGIPYR